MGWNSPAQDEQQGEEADEEDGAQVGDGQALARRVEPIEERGPFQITLGRGGRSRGRRGAGGRSGLEVEGGSERVSLTWGEGAGTHLSREQIEELGGEGNQALGMRIIGAAGRGNVRVRGPRGSPVQPGGQQRHAGLQHRGQHVEKQQEAQQREIGLGARAKLTCRGQ